jgi:hypothetical protein
MREELCDPAHDECAAGHRQHEREPPPKEPLLFEPPGIAKNGCHSGQTEDQTTGSTRGIECEEGRPSKQGKSAQQQTDADACHAPIIGNLGWASVRESTPSGGMIGGMTDASVHGSGPDPLRCIFCGEELLHDPESEHWIGEFARGPWDEYLYEPAAHDVCLREHLHPSVKVRTPDWQPRPDPQSPQERFRDRLNELRERGPEPSW